jgi:hypothetical protein
VADKFFSTVFIGADFDEVRLAYIDSEKGSYIEKVLLKCLCEKASTFKHFKSLYHYCSGDSSVRQLILEKMILVAKTFDDWYYIFFVSGEDLADYCLEKMKDLADGIYELRCVYMNLDEGDWRREVIEEKVSRLNFSTNEVERAYDACIGSDRLREIIRKKFIFDKIVKEE